MLAEKSRRSVAAALRSIALVAVVPGVFLLSGQTGPSLWGWALLVVSGVCLAGGVLLGLCPSCRRPVPRQGEASACPRCGCDLSH